jgi:hypothetical protein
MSIFPEREEAGMELFPPRAVEPEMRMLRLRGVSALEEENRVVGADHAAANRLVSCHG